VINVSVNERNIRALERKLERFANQVAQPVEANREASIALYGWTIRNFDRQGGLHSGWAPLHPRTVKEKARIGKEQMLVRTGALRSSFTSFYSKDNAGVGSELTYSKFHEEGTGNMPARPMLPPRAVVLDIGLRVYGQYIARKVKEANA
jgi:phage gpG-like protein